MKNASLHLKVVEPLSKDIVTLIDFIYNVVAIPALRMALFFASWFSVKARTRTSGSGTDTALRALSRQSSARATDRTRIWFHAASMGEFEQLLPIIGRMRAMASDLEVVATCFSPSAIDAVKTNSDVDIGLLIPIDSRREMEQFIAGVSPHAAVFNRYDLWRNAVLELSRRNVPIVLTNATMPSVASSRFLRSWVGDTYSRCTLISAVSAEDSRRLADLTSKHVGVLPDTRIDRVLDRIACKDPLVLQWKRIDVLTLVCGSTWRRDEQMLLGALDELSRNGTLQRPLRLIIAPHEPVESVLESIESRIQCTRLSNANGLTEGHLLVDGVGKLLSIYSIADAAFVGGGFHRGVHSVTEPTGYNIPVACGPNIQRSRDAVELAGTEALTVINSVDNLAAWITDIANNSTKVQEIRAVTRTYISAHSGSASVYATKILEIMSAKNRDQTLPRPVPIINPKDVCSRRKARGIYIFRCRQQ